jgi:hypothetical protein
VLGPGTIRPMRFDRPAATGDGEQRTVKLEPKYPRRGGVDAARDRDVPWVLGYCRTPASPTGDGRPNRQHGHDGPPTIIPKRR